MSLLLENVTEDTNSSPQSAVGPVLVTVTGNLGGGYVEITAEIFAGGGYAKAYTYYAGDSTSFFRLEFTAGVTYIAKLIGASGEDTDVVVADLAVT